MEKNQLSQHDSQIPGEPLSRINAPIEEARTLPTQTYYSQEFHDAEREKIFSRHWVSVLFDFDVAEPGQALPFELCGMPLLAVRGLDEKLRVFHNIVPYDGCLAVLEPAQGLERIETPYHGWVYDLEGRLLQTPYWDGTPEGNPEPVAGFDTDLIEVHCETFLHTVCINLSREPESFQDHVAPITSQFSDYDFGQIAVAVDTSGRPIVPRTVTHCNWKIFFDGAAPGSVPVEMSRFGQGAEVPLEGITAGPGDQNRVGNAHAASEDVTLSSSQASATSHCLAKRPLRARPGRPPGTHHPGCNHTPGADKDALRAQAEGGN